MDILTWTIVIGMATGFATEALSLIGGAIFWVSWNHRIARLIITIPAAFGAALLLAVPWPAIFVVTVAAGFFSNALLTLIDRATIVVTPRR